MNATRGGFILGADGGIASEWPPPEPEPVPGEVADWLAMQLDEHFCVRYDQASGAAELFWRCKGVRWKFAVGVPPPPPPSARVCTPRHARYRCIELSTLPQGRTRSSPGDRRRTAAGTRGSSHRSSGTLAPIKLDQPFAQQVDHLVWCRRKPSRRADPRCYGGLTGALPAIGLALPPLEPEGPYTLADKISDISSLAARSHFSLPLA